MKRISAAALVVCSTRRNGTRTYGRHGGAAIDCTPKCFFLFFTRGQNLFTPLSYPLHNTHHLRLPNHTRSRLITLNTSLTHTLYNNTHLTTGVTTYKTSYKPIYIAQHKPIYYNSYVPQLRRSPLMRKEDRLATSLAHVNRSQTLTRM